MITKYFYLVYCFFKKKDLVELTMYNKTTYHISKSHKGNQKLLIDPENNRWKDKK